MSVQQQEAIDLGERSEARAVAALGATESKACCRQKCRGKHLSVVGTLGLVACRMLGNRDYFPPLLTRGILTRGRTELLVIVVKCEQIYDTGQRVCAGEREHAQA